MNEQDVATGATAAMRALVVDDEALARMRLGSLLQDLQTPPVRVVGEASCAAEALEQMARMRPDLVLLDIHMPGINGMELARRLQSSHPHSAVVFVTAHGEHALEAFEVAAVDYLTKPVRRERLQAAVEKAAMRVRPGLAGPLPEGGGAGQDAVSCARVLVIHERGQMLRMQVDDILHAKAELKYVTLHLRGMREIIWDGTLSQLEERYPGTFVRIHRNSLVRRQQMRRLKKTLHPELGEVWLLEVDGIPAGLPVSRRQLAHVRQELESA